jgi:hypothetical protein
MLLCYINTKDMSSISPNAKGITTVSRSKESLHSTKIERKRARGTIAAASFMLASSALLLVGCGPTEAKPDPSPDNTTEVQSGPKTEYEKMLENIAERPAPGTEEYEELGNELFGIPYVEGQAPEEVVDRLDEAFFNWSQAGYKDGPKTPAAVTEIQLENKGSTTSDIVNTLELGYYSQMAQGALFEPNFAQSTEGQSTSSALMDANEDWVEDIMIGQIRPDQIPNVTDHGIKSSSNSEIVGVVTTRSAYGEGTYRYKLVAFDEDGDSEPDSWRFAGNQ